MEVTTAQAALLGLLAQRPLARTDGRALHRQCADTLRDALEELHYPAAVPLPPEKDLAAAFGVSRPTLRQAMARLADDGVLHSQRGVGAFALRGGLVRSANLNSLYRDLIANGGTPVTRVLLLEAVPADDRRAEDLKVEPGTRLLRVDRVRYDGDLPLIITRTHLALPPGVTLTREQLEADGLYNLLHRVAGIELVGGSQTVRARRIRPDEAELLEFDADTAVMVAHRIAFDALGRGVEDVEIVYPEGTELITDLRGTSVRPTSTEGA